MVQSLHKEAERLAREEVPQYRYEPAVGAMISGASVGATIGVLCMFAGLSTDKFGLPIAAVIVLVAGGAWLYLRSVRERYYAAYWGHTERLKSTGR